MDELVEPAELAGPAGRQGRELLASRNRLGPRLQHLRDVARGIGVGAHLVDVPGAVIPTAKGVHERRRVHDLGLLRHEQVAAAGELAPSGVLRQRRPDRGPVPQIIIGIDVDDLIEWTEFGVPIGPQFGVLLPQGQPLGEAFFKFGHGPGAKGIGADFVDHRRILQVTGAGEVTRQRTDGASDPIAAGIKYIARSLRPMLTVGFVRLTDWLGRDAAGRLTRWLKSHIAATPFRRLSSSMLSGSTCGSRSATGTSRISSPSVGSTSLMKPSAAGC